MRDAVLDRGAPDGTDTVDFLLAWGELVGSAGGVADDDHGVEDVVVQAAEAGVGQRSEAGGAQVGQDVVVAAVLSRVGRAGRRISGSAAVLVGQGE
ncbi:hypothetical protein ABZ800_28710 [Streptomyces sp. NPDC047813]|uniref:hypothetical protein n=1 Tax=Streptomyces sp. NPDC047813 TaxID=3154608 RepID=UPI003402B292